jgi:hypothetical protein
VDFTIYESCYWCGTLLDRIYAHFLFLTFVLPSLLLADDNTMPSLTPMDAAAAKILIEEDQASSSNMMDLVENIGEIPTETKGSMKKKRQTTQRKSRK